jgi:hypothetical protein
MSSLAVLNFVKAGVLNAIPDVPFYPTINSNPGRLTNNAWCTIIPVASSEDPKSIGCKPALYRETGTIAVGVLTKTGAGPDIALAALEDVRDYFRDLYGLNGFLYVHTVTPPQDDTRGKTDGNFYLMTVDLNYSYDFYR